MLPFMPTTERDVITDTMLEAGFDIPPGLGVDASTTAKGEPVSLPEVTTNADGSKVRRSVFIYL